MFTQNGEVGAAVLVAVWVAGLWPLREGWGLPAQSEEAAQHHLVYPVLTGECHPCHEGQSPLSQKQHFASNPLFCPPLVSQLLLWGGLLPNFFFQTAPLSLPRSHNQCKGCSRDLRWFLTSPPRKFNREVTSISLPCVASLGPCRPGATLGAATSWSCLLMEASSRCTSSAGDGSP